MMLCLWYKFSSLAGVSQTLFYMSNCYCTKHVYVRHNLDTADLVFGVQHAYGGKAEQQTYNGSGIARGGIGYWQHMCWSI